MAKIKKKKEKFCEETNPIVEKRDALIKNLQAKLLTKDQLKKGGPAVRSQFGKESYQAEIDEINAFGRLVGEAPISLGKIRK